MSKLFRTITSRMDTPANGPRSIPASPYTRIFIRDMRVDMLVGIYEHEKQAKQPVLINLQADVTLPQDGTDNYDNVVCYETIANAIKRIAGSGHINLLETLAEHIAEFCLQDKRVNAVTVRVEKTAVFDFAHSAGVEINRHRMTA
jgi:dihydroneopterin aldolase